MFVYAIFYFAVYHSVILLSIWLGNLKVENYKALLIKSLAVFLIYGFFRYFYQYRYLVDNLSGEDYRFAKALLQKTKWIFALLLPFSLFYYFADRKTCPMLYGITSKGVNFKPYWLMLLFMVPIVLSASFTQDFQDYYPVYKKSNGDAWAMAHNYSVWLARSVYEFFYTISFFRVELVFRGVLIFGMIRYLGEDVVLPMVAVYATIHFGKPLGETISSVFGGYTLGILALKSKNIWGGIFIHGGVALLMEIFAFMHM